MKSFALKPFTLSLLLKIPSFKNSLCVDGIEIDSFSKDLKIIESIEREDQNDDQEIILSTNQEHLHIGRWLRKWLKRLRT